MAVREFESGVGMRKSPVIASVMLSVLLAGCVEDWNGVGPRTAPGGMGIQANGVVADGPQTVSSITQLPVGNSKGPIPPFGTRGHANA